jgi:hypothetical protein
MSDGSDCIGYKQTQKRDAYASLFLVYATYSFSSILFPMAFSSVQWRFGDINKNFVICFVFLPTYTIFAIK